MNRVEFIRELEYLLQDIPEEEKSDALAYYHDYLEEAGEEHEEDVIREFGSPERVAAIIRADLRGNLNEGGEFTESGYQDERFREPRYQVAECHRSSGESENGEEWQDAEPRWSGQGRKPGHLFGRNILSKGSLGSQILKIILILALICVASPVFLGVGGGLLGIAVGLLTLLIGAVVLAAVLTVAAWIGAVALIVLGVGLMFAYPWSGVLILGCGIFVIGLAFLGVAVSILIYGKLIPFCICGVVNWLNRILYRKRRDRT